MAKLEYQDALDSKFRTAHGANGAVNVNVIAGGSSSAAGITPTDKSGTIAAGGTAQVLAAANASRKGYWIQNLSTGDLWVNTNATAVASQPSLKIPAGVLYEAPANGVSVGAISIIGATTSQAFSAREW